MKKDLQSRLAEVEVVVGRVLPDSYVEYLANHRSKDLFDAYLVSNPDYWGVRTVFGIDDGPTHAQADEVFRLVGDAIPKLTFPVADDSAGDLYLLDLSQGGRIVLWRHEREEDDDSVVEIVQSFAQFVSLIRESPAGS